MQQTRRHAANDHAARFELMLAPLFAGSEFGVHTAQGLASLILVAALWAAGAHATGVLLFVPTILAHLAAAYWGGAPLHLAALTLRVLFFGYTTGLTMWRALREPEVTIDTIAGAACVYTLLALVWGNLYMLLEFFHPGSFQIPAAWRMGPEGDPGPALIYFSFITLTTVGYGDISPPVAGRRRSCCGRGRRRATLSRSHDRPTGRLAHFAARLSGDIGGREQNAEARYQLAAVAAVDTEVRRL